MNEDALHRLLSAVTQIQTISRPSSPPCNDFSDSILSAPVPQNDNTDELFDLTMPAYDPAVPSFSSSASTFSPLIGDQPSFHGKSHEEKFVDFAHYAQTTFERLIKRIKQQQIELSSLREQAERRHNRHTLCITELQDKVYKNIPKKRKRESPLSPIFCQQSSPPSSPGYPEFEQYSHVDEVQIKDSIGQFLKSWNRNYRCGHHFRENCKFEDSKCFRFHENAKHSVIAKELRAVLQAKGDISASNFFMKIQDDVDKGGYNCGQTLQSVKAEILGLTRIK
jgi:hypothetical protein